MLFNKSHTSFKRRNQQLEIYTCVVLNAILVSKEVINNQIYTSDILNDILVSKEIINNQVSIPTS